MTKEEILVTADRLFDEAMRKDPTRQWGKGGTAGAKAVFVGYVQLMEAKRKRHEKQ